MFSFFPRLIIVLSLKWAIKIIEIIDFGGPKLKATFQAGSRSSKKKGRRNRQFSLSADFSKIGTVPTIGHIRTRFQWFYDLQNVYFQMSIVTIAEECGDYSKSTLKNTDFGAFFWSTSNRFSKIVLFFPITFIHT